MAQAGDGASASAGQSNIGSDLDCAMMDMLAAALSVEGTPPERVDTHGAAVLLGRDTVFKVKRRRKFPYMDFSTLTLRGRAAAAEIRLNRRTAPHLYLGLRPVLDIDGDLRLGPLQKSVLQHGPAETPDGCVDWVIVMRRFDGTRLFSAMAEKGELTPSMMVSLADRVHAFHAGEPPAAETQIAAVRAIVEGNLEELAGCEALDGEQLQSLSALSRDWVDRLSSRLEDRARAGLVRHCHGDLHLGNVVSTAEGPLLFDALEFDLSFATIDIAYDNAFLLMDLDRFGLSHEANAFFNRILDLGADYGALGPLPLFLSMRAAIRSKIAVSAAETQTASDKADGKREEASAYLDRALSYLRPALPSVVAVGGLSGTGKTSVSRAIAPFIGPIPGAVVVRSDAIRKRLAGAKETETLNKAWYSMETNSRVYEEMASIAGRALLDGHSVVLDAVASKPDERALFETVAGDRPFTGIWLSADAKVLKSRVAERVGDASDATIDVVDRQLGYDLGPLDWTVVQAEADLDAVAKRVLENVSFQH